MPLERLSRQAHAAAGALGRRPRPTASSSRSAAPTAPGARSATRRRWRRCARIAQALLERKLSAERPIAILSGNDIEHALLGARRDVCRHPLCADLGALFADVERLRQAQVDHRDPHARPGVRRRRPGRSRARSTPRCRPASRSWSRANPPAGRPATPFAELLATAADRRGRRRARQGRSRHHRENPVHLGLDRHTRRASSTPSACCARTRR